VLKHDLTPADPKRAVDLLAALTSVSRSALKDAMNKGAVWLVRKGQRRRLRRATAELGMGDRIELFFDKSLLSSQIPALRMIADHRRYSVWHKPAGVLAEGTDFGDHCAMERLVASTCQPERPVFIVHRLDREAAGLMLIAHDREAAARFSRLFAGDGVDKRYRVQVSGRLEQPGRIESPLDGKSALTEYFPESFDAASGISTSEIRIHTGRLHQIRRHMEAIGHPVMGDPRYGRGNKNREGLRLCAVRLAFNDPFSGQARLFQLEPADIGF
jgi:tRNA pseudouridine32 synthase/23S rRNA pseudouridine746 synthase